MLIRSLRHVRSGAAVRVRNLWRRVLVVVGFDINDERWIVRRHDVTSGPIGGRNDSALQER